MDTVRLMFSMCAPEGFLTFFNSLRLAGLIGGFGLFGLLGYFSIRDAYRFGRKGMSWWIGGITLAIFSGLGCWAAGVVGTLAGTPMLVAFGIGKLGQGRHARDNHTRSRL